MAKELSRMGRQCNSSSQHHRNLSLQKATSAALKSNLSPPPPAPPPRDTSISEIDASAQLSASVSAECVESLGETLLASESPKVKFLLFFKFTILFC